VASILNVGGTIFLLYHGGRRLPFDERSMMSVLKTKPLTKPKVWLMIKPTNF
jgi:hypothetical protein